MAKSRQVKIGLNFLCTGRAEASTAIGRIDTFISGEREGSSYHYQEIKNHEGEVQLVFQLKVVIEGKSEDDTIETKLDNSLSSFPELYPGTEPRFQYTSNGVEGEE